MAGRTPAEAVNAFIESFGKAVSSLTSAVVNVGGGGYHPSPEPHVLILNDGSAIRLSGDLFMFVSQRYRIVEDVEPRGPWKVAVVGYVYSLENAARQELISYQWHPAGRSPVTFPHFHLGPASRVGEERVGRAHLPTGRIAPQSFFRLVLTEFDITPRRADWEAVLDDTQTAFAEWGWP